MKHLVATLKPITAWQALLLIIALVGSGLGSYTLIG